MADLSLVRAGRRRRSLDRIFLTDAGNAVRESVEAQWLEIEEEILTD